MSQIWAVDIFHRAGFKTSFKVVRKKDGGWMISLPSKKKADGSWEDIVSFVSRDARLAAEEVIGHYLADNKQEDQPKSSPPRDKPSERVSVNTSGITAASAGLPRRPF